MSPVQPFNANAGAACAKDAVRANPGNGDFLTGFNHGDLHGASRNQGDRGNRGGVGVRISLGIFFYAQLRRAGPGYGFASTLETPFPQAGVIALETVFEEGAGVTKCDLFEGVAVGCRDNYNGAVAAVVEAANAGVAVDKKVFAESIDSEGGCGSGVREVTP